MLKRHSAFTSLLYGMGHATNALSQRMRASSHHTTSGCTNITFIPPVIPSLCLSVCPSLTLSVHPSLHLSIPPSVHPSTCPSICPSILIWISLSLSDHWIFIESGANSRTASRWRWGQGRTTLMHVSAHQISGWIQEWPPAAPACRWLVPPDNASSTQGHGGGGVWL
mgnify:CR=1 FL=1